MLVEGGGLEGMSKEGGCIGREEGGRKEGSQSGRGQTAGNI